MLVMQIDGLPGNVKSDQLPNNCIELKFCEYVRIDSHPKKPLVQSLTSDVIYLKQMHIKKVVDQVSIKLEHFYLLEKAIPKVMITYYRLSYGEYYWQWRLYLYDVKILHRYEVKAANQLIESITISFKQYKKVRRPSLLKKKQPLTLRQDNHALLANYC